MRTKTITTHVALLAAVGLIGFGTTTKAQSQTNLTVSATVVAGCTGLSTTPLNFGTYFQGGTAQLTSTATVSLTCGTGVGYSVNAEGGFQTNGLRFMMLNSTYTDDPTHSLIYELFRDAGFGEYWGGMGGAAISGIGTGAAQTITVYGRLGGGQRPVAGPYGDLIIVTVTF